MVYEALTKRTPGGPLRVDMEPLSQASKFSELFSLRYFMPLIFWEAEGCAMSAHPYVLGEGEEEGGGESLLPGSFSWGLTTTGTSHCHFYLSCSLPPDLYIFTRVRQEKSQAR